MKSAFLIAIFCAAGPGALAYQGPAAGASIEGQVVNPDSGAPVRNATVTLYSSGGRVMRPGRPLSPYQSSAVDTDDQGRFAFRDLSAGGYQLRVQRRGAMNSQPNGPTVYVGEGQQLKNVRIALATQAVVTGKVRDEYGDPLQNVQVSLLRQFVNDAGAQWSTSGSAQTSDLGEYRMVVASPGSYLVAATLREYGMRTMQPGGPLPGPELAYVPTYYPHTVDLSQATRVEVGVSGEVRNIDIQLTRVPTVRIRGRVIDPSPTPNRMPSVTLRPKQNPNGLSPGMSMSGMNGEFEISGVVPGSYTLTAIKYPESGSGMTGFVAQSATTPPLAAVLPIEVGNRSIEGVTLQLSPGKDVQGTIQAPPELQGNMRVSQISASMVDGAYPGNAPSAANISGTSFTLKNIIPGRYVVRAYPGMANAYVKTVRYGGKEIPPEGVDLSTGQSIEIVVATDVARLDGKVSSPSGGPLGPITVVLLAGPRQNTIRPANGEFRFGNLTPGEYKAIAIESSDINVTQNPQLLKVFEDRVKTVKAEGGQTAAVSLTAVTAVELRKYLPGGVSSAYEHVKGSVAGRVVNSVTGQPVAHAVVKLGGQGYVRATLPTGNGMSGVMGAIGSNEPAGVSMQTDEEGRFTFADVAPGQYQLGAEHQGFVFGMYAPSRNGAGEGLVVGEGQMLAGLALKIAPQGVIAGRVLDESGSPMEQVRMVLLQRTYSRGQVRYASVSGMTQTDDLGEYRIPGLSAGVYVIGARVSRATGTNGGPLPDQPDMDYPATYFPNVLDPDQAKLLTLAAGVQSTGVDIIMRKMPLYRVRGRVAGAGPRSVPLEVWPKGGGTRRSALTPSGAVDSQGNFEVRGLPPGVYTLTARLPAGTATGTVEIRDRNVDGFGLEPVAEQEVKGTVLLDGQPAQNFSLGLAVTLEPVDGGNSGGMGSFGGGPLTFRNVAPIPYRVNVENMGNTCACYVDSVTYGGQPIGESGAVLTGGGRLEILLRSKAATVDGTVVDRQGNPVPWAVVAILPQGGPLSRMRSGTADERGRFSWPNNAPGDYKLLAWEDIDLAAADDPAVLQQVDGSAKTVRLDPDGRPTLQLAAIPKGR